MLLITLQGLPPAITLDGIFLVTTLLAPITEFLPIDTPFKIVAEYPIKTLSQIITGLLFGIPWRRSLIAVLCQSKSVIKTLAPTKTSFPIIIDCLAPITTALNPQFS